MHAHKIRDITSKTIRANARLFQQYKTENLPEAGLLEILSQQVMLNLEKQSADLKAAVSKQEELAASEKLSKKQILEEPLSTVVFKEQSSVVTGGFGAVNDVNCAIKMENGCDTDDNNCHEKTATVIQNSMPADVPLHYKLQIKEENEIFDASSENTFTVTEVIPLDKIEVKKEDQKSSLKNQRIRQKPDIEKVFLGGQRSADLTVKDEVVMDEFKIIELGDSIEPFNSADITKFSTSPAKASVREPTETKSQNRNPNIKAYKCDICPKSYSQKSKLKIHMRKHSATATTNDTVKMCEICGKTYNENSALTKHIKFTHFNFRPFSCETCGRAFKDSSGLKVSTA